MTYNVAREFVALDPRASTRFVRQHFLCPPPASWNFPRTAVQWPGACGSTFSQSGFAGAAAVPANSPPSIVTSLPVM